MNARPTPLRSAGGALARQKGMSLVELMVGITIGLFIVAAATLLVGNQLSDNRRLLLETQLQQDMRVSMDIMTRQIRRAGTRKPNESLTLLAGHNGVPGRFDPEYTDSDINAAGDQITFDYFLDPTNDQRLDGNPARNWGFRLTNGRVMTNLGEGGWQELTDRATVNVTALQFTPILNTSEGVSCPKLCPDNTINCWPRSAVRAYVITLQAEAASDPLVKRRMQAVARVRNNLPVFNANSVTQPCPP